MTVKAAAINESEITFLSIILVISTLKLSYMKVVEDIPQYHSNTVTNPNILGTSSKAFCYDHE